MKRKRSYRKHSKCKSTIKLPYELIDIVIDYVLTEAKNKNAILIQLCKISKPWQAIATRRLYASISLDHHTNDRASEGLVLGLCKTLRRNLELSSYIKTLSIRFVGHRAIDRRYLRLLRLCSKTTHLILNGRVPYDPLRLTDILVGMNLRTIHFSVAPAIFGDEYLFRSPTAFVRFLRVLPHIEEVKCVTWMFPENPSRRNTKLLGPACLAAPASTSLPLVQLDFSHNLSTEAIQAISTLPAPRLKNFRLAYSASEGMDDAVIQCLETWASHLEGISLFRHSARIPNRRAKFVDILNNMDSLEYLEVSNDIIWSRSALFIQSSTLSVLALEDPIDNDDIIALASQLEEKNGGSGDRAQYHLPALTHIRIITRVFRDQLREDLLTRICRLRKIIIVISAPIRGGNFRQFSYFIWTPDGSQGKAWA